MKVHNKWSTFCFKFYAASLPKVVLPAYHPFFGNKKKNTADIKLHVTYTNDASIVDRWIQTHILGNSSTSIIGLDTESVPRVPWIRPCNFEGVATIQLSTLQSSLVVHLTRGPHQENNEQESAPSLCSSIHSVLQNPNIVKVGVNIDHDIVELHKWNPQLFSCCNCRLDIGGISFSSSSSARVGLSTLARNILGVELKQSKTITLSDWSQIPLSVPQINYAARDAWAAVAILDILAKLDPLAFGTNPIRQRVLQSELPIRDLLLFVDKKQQRRPHFFDVGDLGFRP